MASRKENPELYMPSAWATKFAIITKRLEKTAEGLETPRAKNFHGQTMKILSDLVFTIEKAYKPSPPKTIVQGQKYALSRKFNGTYFGLMDKDGHLIKTLIVAKEILAELPEYVIQDEVIEVKMTARKLRIPQLDFERSIPKRTEKVIPFACNRETEEIIKYNV